jgi:hypothetical protein
MDPVHPAIRTCVRIVAASLSRAKSESHWSCFRQNVRLRPTTMESRFATQPSFFWDMFDHNEDTNGVLRFVSV